MVLKKALNIIVLMAIVSGLINQAWGQKQGKIKISAMVVDIEGEPIRGALVFVDYVQINNKTNNKGKFNIKVSSMKKTISVYSPEHGVLSSDIRNQPSITFNFTKEDTSITLEELKKLGFKLFQDSKNNTDWYADFSNILEILDKRFYNVRVINGELYIGRGINQFNGDRTPLILVDNRPVSVEDLGTIATTDVKLIRVISQGSEASQYGGLRASNGVILITLKE